VALLGEDVADGRGDGRGRQAGGRDLIEQRREKMVVGAVDHGDLRGRLAQRLRGPEARESATEDDDAGRRHFAMIQAAGYATGALLEIRRRGARALDLA